MGKSPKKKRSNVEGNLFITREEYDADRNLLIDKYEGQIAKMNENFKILLDLLTEMRHESPGRTTNSFASAAKQGMDKLIGPPLSPEYVQYKAMKSIESNKLHNKDSNLVLVGVSSDVEDVDAAVRKVIRDAHLLDTVVSDAFRHCNKDGKPTSIVKVKLNSTKDKSLLKKVIGSSDLCKFCRDDLTPLELDHDRNLRYWCHKQNESIGKRLFIVRNLLVVELKNNNSKKNLPQVPATHVTTRKTRKPIVSAAEGSNEH